MRTYLLSTITIFFSIIPFGQTKNESPNIDCIVNHALKLISTDSTFVSTFKIKTPTNNNFILHDQLVEPHLIIFANELGLIRKGEGNKRPVYDASKYKIDSSFYLKYSFQLMRNSNRKKILAVLSRPFNDYIIINTYLFNEISYGSDSNYIPTAGISISYLMESINDCNTLKIVSKKVLQIN